MAIPITGFVVYPLITRGGELPHSAENLRPTKGVKDYKHGLTAKDATLILIPSAFVASFLLVKDFSTLTMRLRRFRQAILVFEFFAMPTAAFILFAAGHVWSSP